MDLGRAASVSLSLIYFRTNFHSKIFLSTPCQVSWAEFTLSGSVSISTGQRVYSKGMVNEFGEKPERKNAAPLGPGIPHDFPKSLDRSLKLI